MPVDQPVGYHADTVRQRLTQDKPVDRLSLTLRQTLRVLQPWDVVFGRKARGSGNHRTCQRSAPRFINAGKRLQVIGSVMRSQPLENKIAITERFRRRWLPELESGRLQPLIDTSFPLAEAAAAHQYMEDNRNVGKIMLVMD